MTTNSPITLCLPLFSTTFLFPIKRVNRILILPYHNTVPHCRLWHASNLEIRSRACSDFLLEKRSTITRNRAVSSRKQYQPEYALSLNISKLRGINKTGNGWCSSNDLSVSVLKTPPSEFVSAALCVHAPAPNVNLEWGVKFITTGDPRDRIATTG